MLHSTIVITAGAWFVFACNEPTPAPAVKPKPAEPAKIEPTPAKPAANAAVAPTPPKPPANVIASKFPACTEVDVPDDDARLAPAAKTAIRELGTALATNDASKLAPLLAARVKLDKTTTSADETMAKLAKDGPQVVVGFEPNEFFDTTVKAKKCTWTLKTTAVKDGLEVFTGSGYGKTKVARLSQIDGAWRIVGFETVDYGEP